MRKLTLFIISLLCYVGVLHAEALVADGVYTLSADVNKQRGELVAANDYNYPVLEGIDLNGYTQNSTDAMTNGQYWYVRSVDASSNIYYIYNIAKGKYLVNDNGYVDFGDTPYEWTFVTNTSKQAYLNIKDAKKTGDKVWLSSGCGRSASDRPVQWDSNNNDGGALYTFERISDYFATPETGKFYKIKGTHSTNPWLTATVEGGGIDVAENEDAAAVYLKTAKGLKAISTGKYIGTGGNGEQISLVDEEADVTIEKANACWVYIKTGGRYLYNNQPDYTREAGNKTATGNAEHPKWGFIEVEAPAAIVDGVLYETLADALEATETMTGDVTVEILDKVTFNQPLIGSYSSINFVGKAENAEMYLDVQGYTTATGKEVTFTDLKLSKSEGGYVANAGFMNLAFGIYDVNKVTYNNCTFLNGACASSGDVTFNGCTFYRSWDRYGLWAYGAPSVTVEGCTFADIRGIKLWDEGKQKLGALTVKNTNFSAVTDKPAIVLTSGKSVTLAGNTYNAEKGTLELDLDGNPNGTPVTSDVTPVCVNDNGACGVLVDGKIYTTVAQAAEVATSGSTVTLLHNSAETVVLPMGATLNKGDFTADNVTVAAPVAKVGDVEYASIQEAIDAAAEGATIILLENVEYVNFASATDKTTSINVPAGKKFTLDLNGYVISGENSLNGNFAFMTICSGADVTIDDTSATKTGKIVYTSTRETPNENHEGYTIRNKGVLTLNGGTIANDTPLASNGYEKAVTTAVDNCNSSGTASSFTMNGGVVVSNTYFAIRSSVYANNTSVAAQGVVVLNGGTAYGLHFCDWGSKGLDYQVVIGAGAVVECGNYPELTNQSLRLAIGTAATSNVAINIAEEAQIKGAVYGAKAKIGARYYTKLQEAVAALKDGETLTITGNVTPAANEFIELNGKKNVTIAAAEGVVINGNISVGYHASHTDNNVDRSASTFTVDGLTVNGTLTVCSNDAALVVKNTKAAQITVKTYREGINIALNNNTADGSMGEAANSYGMFIVPNATGYNLTVDGNTFKNINSHAFVVQGCGDGSAVTAANSIVVANNDFESWGTGGKDDRAAFKIWADTKYAPEASDLAGTTNAMRELVDAIAAGGNTYSSTAENTVEFDAYGAAGDAAEFPDPMYAVAKIGDVEYDNLQKAVDAAGEGDVIVLVDDVEGTVMPTADTTNNPANAFIVVAASKVVTLDLNGKTISVTGDTEAKYDAIGIRNHGNLTIVDNSEAKNGKLTYQFHGEKESGSSQIHSTILNFGTLTVNSGTLENNSTKGYAKYTINNYSWGGNANVTINGGHISNATTVAVYADGYSDFGTNSCNVTVTGGTVEGGLWYNGRTATEAKNIVISGGTFIEGTNAALTIKSGVNTAVVSGGIFQGAVSIAEGIKAISGGTFSAPVNEAYCAEGYVPAQNEDGTYGVVEAPTDVKVTTLAELQAALADNNNELPIIITAQIEIPAGETVTIDLNGKTVTVVYQEESTTRHIYALSNYGTLTIKDTKGNGSINSRGIFVQDGSKLTVESGSIYGIDSNGGSALYQYGGDIVINGGHIEQKAEGTYNFAINALGGTVTVNGGKIAGNHGAIAAGGATVVINDGELVCTGTAGMTDNVLYTYDTGEITINGGTFVADNDVAAGGCCVYDGNGKATINGGTFSNSSGGDVWGTTGTTIKGGTFENLIEKQHIADGYELGEDGTVVQVNYVAMIGEQGYATLQAAIDAAILMTGDVTIEIMSGTYAQDINLTNAAVTAGDANARPNITFKPAADADVTFAGTTTLGYRVQNVGASMWQGEVTFEGITFDHAEDGKHSLDIQDVKGITLLNCTVTGDGEYGIGSNGSNATPKAAFTNCTFENGAMQVLGQLSANLVIDNSTFNNFSINAQGGTTPGLTIKNSIFNMTLTDAHVGQSFYVVRSNANPINIQGTKVNVDSEVSTVAESQAKWGLFWARQDANAKWVVDGCEVNLTEAAMAQTELLFTKNAATTYDKAKERIVITNLTSASNNVADLVKRAEGCATVNGVNYKNGERDLTGMVAKIGETYYASLEAAVEAANAVTDSQVTITLLADIDYSGDDITANVVLDLNGKTVTSTGGYFFWLDAGKLTVKDSSDEKTGKLYGVTTGNAILVYGNSTLLVEDVEIFSNNNVITTFETNNTVVVNGGKLEANSATQNSAALYLAGSESTVTINAGTIIGNIPFNNGTLLVTGGSYTKDVSGYCAAGYAAALNSETGMYEIVAVTAENAAAKIGDRYFLTLNAALQAATVESTIVVLKDFEGNLESLKGTIVPAEGKTVTVNATNTGWYYLGSDFTIGEGVTFNMPNAAFFVYYTDEAVIKGKVTVNGLYIRYAGTRLTVEAPGALNVTGETFIIRDVAGDGAAGLYIVGDDNDETVELTAPVVYFYQGMINAKDANINVGTYWQTQETDAGEYPNAGAANLVLDNSVLNVTVRDHAAKATGNSTVTLKNGALLNTVNSFIGNAAITVDAAGITANTIVISGNVEGLTGEITLTGNDVATYAKTAEGLVVVIPKVAAIGETVYATLQAAVEAAQTGEKVVVLENIELSTPVVVAADKMLTLDLNGKTVSYTSAVAGEDMITNNGNLTITDSSDAKTGKLAYVNTDNTASNVTVSTISTEPGSTLVVDGGTIENKTVKADGSSIYSFAIDILTNGNLGDVNVTINGGVIKSGYMAIRQFNNGTACVNSLTITGGHIYGAKRAVQVHMDNNAAVTAIEGGKVEAGEGGYAICNFAATSNLAVTGGEFVGAVYSKCEGFITGGTFNAEVYSGYLAEHFICQTNGDGTYGVVADPSYIAELEIIDGVYGNYTNEEEMTVGKLTYVRTLPAAGKWYPVFLPFDVPVEALAENFDVARINDLHTNFSEEDGSIEKMWVEYIVRKSGTLPAGKPFLVRAKSSDVLDMVIELENVTLKASDEKSSITVRSAITKVTFEGVYEVTSGLVSTPSTRYMAVTADGVWDEFDGYSLNPFRVMMTLEILDEEYYINPAASLSVGARVIGEENEDGTTVIYDVYDEVAEDMIFDLQGRRVLETEKGGIYIIGGKKVLVK